MNARRTPRVAVIGAGAGGLCMGAALRRLGVTDFTIFEQSDGIGGTWHDSTYPGAGVDTPVPFYSFSFHPFDFSRLHVLQPELLQYLESLADRFDLLPHIRLQTAVTRAEWDEATHSYEVTTADGERERFDVVVSAVGLLNYPKLPDWPGLESFRGPAFHSSRWHHGVDLSGKRVAIVGTGSSGAQLAPALAPVVEKLYVFQRQPGWVLPNRERAFTSEERARLQRPWNRRRLRWQQVLAYERGQRAKIAGSRKNAAVQRVCEAYIAEVFKNRPELAAMVTPDYPYSGKRTVKDANFYSTLLRDNVELVPHAVASVTATGVVDDTGAEREIDVLVMSTGFQPANFLATLEVVGRDGRELHEVWNGEPHAYLGLTVANFPNFYILYGPNTNGAPIMFMHERQVEFVAANLRRMIRTGVTAIEVRENVMNAFNRVLQRRLSRSVVAKYLLVHNYGRAATGRDVIGWGEGTTVYTLLARLTPRLSSTARRLSQEASVGAAVTSEPVRGE